MSLPLPAGSKKKYTPNKNTIVNNHGNSCQTSGTHRNSPDINSQYPTSRNNQPINSVNPWPVQIPLIDYTTTNCNDHEYSQGQLHHMLFSHNGAHRNNFNEYNHNPIRSNNHTHHEQKNVCVNDPTSQQLANSHIGLYQPVIESTFSRFGTSPTYPQTVQRHPNEEANSRIPGLIPTSGGGGTMGDGNFLSLHPPLAYHNQQSDTPSIEDIISEMTNSDYINQLADFVIHEQQSSLPNINISGGIVNGVQQQLAPSLNLYSQLPLANQQDTTYDRQQPSYHHALTLNGHHHTTYANEMQQQLTNYQVLNDQNIVDNSMYPNNTMNVHKRTNSDLDYLPQSIDGVQDKHSQPNFVRTYVSCIGHLYNNINDNLNQLTVPPTIEYNRNPNQYLVGNAAQVHSGNTLANITNNNNNPIQNGLNLHGDFNRQLVPHVDPVNVHTELTLEGVETTQQIYQAQPIPQRSNATVANNNVKIDYGLARYEPHSILQIEHSLRLNLASVNGGRQDSGKDLVDLPRPSDKDIYGCMVRHYLLPNLHIESIKNVDSFAPELFKIVRKIDCSCFCIKELLFQIKDFDCWSHFLPYGNECKLNKNGRNIFPRIDFTPLNLQSEIKYRFLLKFCPVKVNSEGSPGGKSVSIEEAPSSCVSFDHPSGFKDGSFWMKQDISFQEIKITNNDKLQNNKNIVLLKSGEKYVVKLAIITHDAKTVATNDSYSSGSINVIRFHARTAYSFSEVTKLKKMFNKYANGERGQGNGGKPSKDNAIIDLRRNCHSCDKMAKSLQINGPDNFRRSLFEKLMPYLRLIEHRQIFVFDYTYDEPLKELLLSECHPKVHCCKVFEQWTTV